MTENAIILQSLTSLQNNIMDMQGKLGHEHSAIAMLKEQQMALKEAFQNQSDRLDTKLDELVTSVRDLRLTVEASNKDLDERITELEHIQTYSKGVTKTIRWLLAAVGTLIATVSGIIIKWLTGG